MNDRFPEPLERLINELSKLPTVGRKSAQRLAFHILKEPDEQATALARALVDVKQKIRFCPQCFYITDAELCHICSDTYRDHAQICVVEEPADVAAFDRSGTYRGLYHVLLGHLSPLHGISADDLKIRELMARLSAGDNPVREVIIATNPNVDGDATALYLSRLMHDLPVEVTRLGLGLSIGSSLEYSDELTLRKAFEGRKAF